MITPLLRESMTTNRMMVFDKTAENIVNVDENLIDLQERIMNASIWSSKIQTDKKDGPIGLKHAMIAFTMMKPKKPLVWTAYSTYTRKINKMLIEYCITDVVSLQKINTGMLKTGKIINTLTHSVIMGTNTVRLTKEEYRRMEIAKIVKNEKLFPCYLETLGYGNSQ